MSTIKGLCRLLTLFLCFTALPGLQADNAPEHRQWMIDGVARQALVYAPLQAKTTATPVVFAFHGHGGTMEYFARTTEFHTQWPEAIVVYMQGLKTPGRLTDPDGKLSGWQHALGGQGDRDLKFFDAVLATLHQEYRVDDKRLYATGHSNGGYFTYLLWAARGDLFAAFAPASAVAEPSLLAKFKPKPVLHIAGQNDPLVKFAWQQQTMIGLRKLNECQDGQPWENEKWCTLYPSKLGAPVVTCIHPGKHELPPPAPALIVKFFKENALP